MKTEQEQQPDWMQELGSSPFNEPMFTSCMKSRVLNSAGSSSLMKDRTMRRSPARSRFMAASILTLLLIAAVWGWRESPALQQLVPIKGLGGSAEWTPHNVYAENGVVKLQAIPGGDFAAGAPAGAWWNLLAPIQELEGKHIRISAVHRDTGTTLEELAETEITSDMAYNDFTRVSSRFGMPLSGLWKFNVMVDDEPYGDIVIHVPDSSWEPSPSFKSGVYDMTGVEGRLGFINPGFIAGQPNKYMWHFWGRSEELTGDLFITAVKRNTSKIIDVFETTLRPGKHNGADAAIPTTMSLPSAGQWRIMASINGQLFGSVIVEVDSP
ncbi:DUF4871 domain-containing protein [Paenibacillus glucanolyticus]|uniref:DUF4871 domain-containing protein n=1 Tax=Paenibacillus glucanolyticus TaxID=59843 RepID=UPI00128CD0CC|nr:DUF4871 domain-containing protein [Paenibacillus glucanolyticus]MPY19971.1 DUF4871 domain-containing protein [Paenibacillus glucanolyticus]